MKTFKVLASTLVAIISLTAIVGTSTASRLSTSSQTFRSGFARWNFSGGFGTMECPLTLEGSLHTRTIAKTNGALIGYITRAIVGTCPRGRVAILAVGFPWHVRYVSFAGTLPNINSIATNVTGANFQITEPIFGVTCLASGGTMTNTYNREAGSNLTTAVIGGTAPTNCGITGTLSGTSNTLTELNGTTRIRVTLI
jgi:hypothetical protein